MRIGIVLPSAPAYSETFFLNKIKGLEEHGFSVIIFANNTNKTTLESLKIRVAPKLKGNKFLVVLVSIYTLFLSFVFYYKSTKRLYNLDKKDGVELLRRLKNIISSYHIVKENLDWLHFGFGTMVFNKENVAKAIGAKMAVSFRGFDIGVYPLKNPNCYLNIWNKTDRIHVISEDIKDLVYMNGFKGESEIVKITPAIDNSLFNIEQRCNFVNENNFVTIARLHWKKGLVYSLEALSVLKTQGLSFHYTIIGDGPDKERLKFAVHQLNLENNVTFTGKVVHQEIINELKKSSIYLQYSIQEGFCNSVLEAQAAGLLCIVSDAEGLSENIINKETGWVVPKCDTTALVNKINKVINLSNENKNIIIKNARERVSMYFTIYKQHQEFIEFYGQSKI